MQDEAQELAEKIAATIWPVAIKSEDIPTVALEVLTRTHPQLDIIADAEFQAAFNALVGALAARLVASHVPGQYPS
jgi:hypothetical protein